MVEKKMLNWEVGHCAKVDAQPIEWVPAIVPGAVQLDWARSKNWGSYQFGDNFKDYDWMEDVYWTYRAPLTTLRPEEGHKIFFISKGIDYRFIVRVDQTVLLEQEGMFTPVKIDITEYCSPDAILYVTVYPAPKSVSDAVDRSRNQANQSCKPAVSYGWDFHPRLIPLGIWDETHLEICDASFLTHAELQYELADDFSQAKISVDAEWSGNSDVSVRWQLLSMDGKLVAEKEKHQKAKKVCIKTRLARPELWWPNEQGEQYLYTSRIELLDTNGTVLDRKQSRVGFRSVRLVTNQGAWEDYTTYPRSRSTPPITIEINGRRIFCKGSNWVSPEIFPGLLTEKTSRDYLMLSKNGHFNMLRCWGGAPVQKDDFFDIADELGIMIWQEFPLSCNNYKGTPDYCKILDQESRSIIKRLRPYASVVLWCGGNELFCSWSGMTEQDAAIRVLNRNTFELDPTRPFIPTSPLMGMAHGGYWFFSSKDGELFESFYKSRHTAYTEFGCEGPIASLDDIQTLLPKEDQVLKGDEQEYSTKRAKEALFPKGRMRGIGIEKYFGVQSTLDDSLRTGHLLQSLGLQCTFEEVRRQWPYASMALSWCYNEPWPLFSSHSIVSWGAQPKAAYFGVKQALRPVLASARFHKFCWKTGEAFSVELWMLNDSPQPLCAGHVEAVLKTENGETQMSGWDFAEIQPNINSAGPTCTIVIPKTSAQTIELILHVKDHAEWDSRYVLRIDAN